MTIGGTIAMETTHYDDVIMIAMASQITRLAIVYSTVHSGTDERKHQSPALQAFVRGIHRWPVNSPHKGPVVQKMFPFDDVIKWTIQIIRQFDFCDTTCQLSMTTNILYFLGRFSFKIYNRVYLASICGGQDVGKYNWGPFTNMV